MTDTEKKPAVLKHTPGPWLSSLEEHGDYIIYVKKGDDEQPGICSCDGSGFIPIDDEAEIAANFNLFLAAPDTLAALNNLRNQVRGAINISEHALRDAIGNTNYNCIAQALNDADIAIAKAERAA